MEDMVDPSFNNNTELAFADAFVRQTGANIFLTGKAGTGKTTFLSGLKKECHKQIMVTAPTGVAAINAGGVTLHSFFQLPFGPYIPGQDNQNRDYQRFFRFSKEKKRIIKGLDLLIIDEISMVRADLLDSVDAVLRRLRRDQRPFGGVQLLLIGDLFQLPPVIKADEWQLLQNYYSSVYFFSSHALAKTEVVTIELKKIYRQSDQKFIDLLNAVRENRLDEGAVALLDQCAEKPVPDQGVITLTTHNRKADDINQDHLDRLSESPHELTAEIDGDFPAHSFPTSESLVLKRGAQVMFLRNDNSPDKLYYNGKIGRVSEIHNDRIVVDDPGGEDHPVEVKPVDWENITYRVNEEDQTIEEEVIGSFSQFPLKLAWAVTIHKSQGLTFDRAVVDAEDGFAHGQTYVALSRCRSLDGLVLSSPIPRNSVTVSPAIIEFMAGAAGGSKAELESRLNGARIDYQKELLLQCFDFTAMQKMFFYFIRLVENNQGSVKVAGLADIEQLKAETGTQIFEVGERFRNQLRTLMEGGGVVDEDEKIRERSMSAYGWFSGKFTTLFADLLEKGRIETDNKALKKQLTNGLDNLCQEIRIRRAGISSCKEGFSSKNYLRAVSKEGMNASQKVKKTKATTADFTELDIEHPEMFKKLKEWRAEVAAKLGVPHFHVLIQKVLIQLAVCLPENDSALAGIKGVGPKTREKYGEDILKLIREYRDEHNIQTVVLPEPEIQEEPDDTAKKKKGGRGTMDITLDFFEQGMSIQAIADERGLVVSTIERHLGNLIEQGTISVDRVIDPDKRAAIEKLLTPGKTMSEIKNELGKDYSYGEIKIVVSHRKFKDAKS